VNDGVIFQELQGESVLLNSTTGVYFGLDTVGTRIWQLLAQHEILSDVVNIMVNEYDVSEHNCGEDLIDLVARMAGEGLVTVTSAKATGSGD
jgi:hypothetical protein